MLSYYGIVMLLLTVYLYMIDYIVFQYFTFVLYYMLYVIILYYIMRGGELSRRARSPRASTPERGARDETVPAWSPRHHALARERVLAAMATVLYCP